MQSVHIYLDISCVKPMKKEMRTILTMTLMLCLAVPVKGQQKEGVEQLQHAIDYFSAGKYHEALLEFSELESSYKLNPRFIAYMGVCEFYEGNYGKAIVRFENSLDKLASLAPQELYLYHYLMADSYFNLQHFLESSVYYAKAQEYLPKKPDAELYYKRGMCGLFMKDNKMALEDFRTSRFLYRKQGESQKKTQRLRQLSHMIGGLSTGNAEDTE